MADHQPAGRDPAGKLIAWSARLERFGLKPELRIGIHASGIVIGVWSVVTGIIDADLPRLALGVLILVMNGLAIRRPLIERRAQQRTNDRNDDADRV